MKSKFPIFGSPNYNRIEFSHLVDTSVTSSSVNIESSLFSCELKKYASKCHLYKDRESCSGLANLCVLSLYNSDNSACRIYNLIMEEKSPFKTDIDSGWVTDLPWIYYKADSDKVIDTNKINLKMAMTYDRTTNSTTGQTSLLPFFLIQYHVNGAIRRFTKLSGDFLLCPHTAEENIYSVLYGTQYKTACELNLTNIFDTQDETFVYELVLQDGDTFVDIPVAVSNMKTDSGSYPNKDKQGPEDLRFVRRFIITDAHSGISVSTSPNCPNPTLEFPNRREQNMQKYLKVQTSGSTIQNLNSAPKPDYITFLSSSVLLIGSQDDPSQLKKPYLLLTYKQKRRDDLQIQSTYPSSHQTVYRHNSTKFNIIIIIFAILFGIIFFLVTISRIYVQSKYYPTGCNHIYPTGRGSIMLQIAIWVIFENLGVMMYVFLLGLTWFWYMFFKWQRAASLVLGSPTYEPSSYRVFYISFWICLGASFIGIVTRIVRGSKVDIFMLDWEKERFTKMRGAVRGKPDAKRGLNSEKSEKSENTLVKKEKEKSQTLLTEADEENRENAAIKRVKSVWRSLLIGNEFNEMTLKRFINSHLLIFIVGMFLLGFKWDEFAATSPYVSKSNPNIEPNFGLKFFINNFLIFGIGVVIYTIRRILIRFFPGNIESFLDFCSIANISVFLFDSPLHGYYIHGKNPTDNSDTSLKEIQKSIDQEAQGKLKGRGLIQNDTTNLQSFEFFFTVDLREQYNYVLAEAQQLATGKKNRKSIPKSMLSIKNDTKDGDAEKAKEKENTDDRDKLLENLNHLDLLEKKKEDLSRLFKRHIEDAVNNQSKYIFDMSASHRFLGLPPRDNLDALDNPIFYKDVDDGFKMTTLMGSDVLLLILDTLVFNAADLIFQNTAISMLAVILYQELLEIFRGSVVENNISKKTLIDERFLI